MTDQKETTATTLWEDLHAGKRGHQLMTQKLADTIPAIYANERVTDYETVLVHAKLFSPHSNWAWFITEMDHATGACFGLVDGLEKEIGYFDLTELAETTVFGGVPAVERDLYWEPRTLGEIKSGSQGGLRRGEETGKGEAMIDEDGAETHPQDVVNVEEFLFGGVTEETVDDADGEVPAGDEADDGDDLETAEGPDAGADAPSEEPDVAADDAGEKPAPDETETEGSTPVSLRIIITVQHAQYWFETHSNNDRNAYYCCYNTTTSSEASLISSKCLPRPPLPMHFRVLTGAPRRTRDGLS